MKVVYSSAHERHDPTIEVEWGVTVRQREQPERAEAIRAALDADPSFEFVAPTDHGLAPIEAVHDPGLVDYLAGAWRELVAEGLPVQPVPDTFVHPALREGMGPAPEPGTAAARLGYWCFETYTP